MAVEAQRAVHIHLSEEAVENYAVGRLPKAQLAAFEEHLLLCEHCQEQLAEEDNFAAAMWSLTGLEDAASLRPSSPAPSSSQTTSSAAELSSSPVRQGGLPSWIPQLRDPVALRNWVTPPWAAAVMLVIVISIGAGIVAWNVPPVWTSTGEAEAVTLTTLRGGGQDGMAQARALRPLDLYIDLAAGGSSDPSAAATSVPESGPYRLKMIDASGRLQWTGVAQPASGKLTARLTAHVEKRLSAGVYWVRLYAPSGKLLREFGLRVSN